MILNYLRHKRLQYHFLSDSQREIVDYNQNHKKKESNIKKV
ncbi:unnamed protein product [Paramecium sonneborni]|uniref:Uncharacterized protein n=1 Tax=Paramecium sonneborni TaxID=65129 RepID=A0A8S1MWA6_9CILI|nr:unnamed protein product [Paramecium sonneborni]